MYERPNQAEIVKSAMERAQGQVERLQDANDRQRRAIDSFVAFLEERGLMADYNVWAARGQVRMPRKVADVQLPDQPATG